MDAQLVYHRFLLLAGLPEQQNAALFGLCEDAVRELERRLQATVREYLMRVEEGYAFLGEVEDSQMRQILNLRYLEGMSWQRVAFAIGEYDEQYPRKKCRRFWVKEEGRI